MIETHEEIGEVLNLIINGIPSIPKTACLTAPESPQF